MGYLKQVLRDERNRLEALCKKYRNEVAALPKGSISIKNRNRNEYLYLAFRQKDKVKFKYIGPTASKSAKDIIKTVKLRKQFEEKLKQAESNLKEVKKAINERKIQSPGKSIAKAPR